MVWVRIVKTQKKDVHRKEMLTCLLISRRGKTGKRMQVTGLAAAVMTEDAGRTRASCSSSTFQPRTTQEKVTRNPTEERKKRSTASTWLSENRISSADVGSGKLS
ncbi:hypothetical protein AAHE18_12G096000 [Arachis hypogaea]